MTEEKITNEEVIEVKPRAKKKTKAKEVDSMVAAGSRVKAVDKVVPLSDISTISKDVYNSHFIGRELTEEKCHLCTRQLYQVEISACDKFLGEQSYKICRSCFEKMMKWTSESYDKQCIHFANDNCKKFCRV